MIKWFIQEIQTDREGNAAFLQPVLKESETEAWSAYYHNGTGIRLWTGGN